VQLLAGIVSCFDAIQSRGAGLSVGGARGRSIGKSILPVSGALLILAVVSAIYAIVGVDLFGEEFPEYFGTFSNSLFTMFQVLTGDSWSSNVARSLSEELKGRQDVHADVALFFVSYILVASFFVFNVVIAVLLDKFLMFVETQKHQETLEQQEQILRDTIQNGTALDPLYLELSSFTSMDDLNNRILSIYRVCSPALLTRAVSVLPARRKSGG